MAVMVADRWKREVHAALTEDLHLTGPTRDLTDQLVEIMVGLSERAHVSIDEVLAGLVSVLTGRNQFGLSKWGIELLFIDRSDPTAIIEAIVRQAAAIIDKYQEVPDGR